ncbi:hypothetical protein WJU16_15295 [Chitinophaga pollutisoli]|uniref:Uncharacterized protein n=1 Tax=Chitinophaga pollutisoli TaxID=3133966 RepID=A0ABZ2YI09_9BACT
MARLKPQLDMEGNLGQLSIYRQYGSDKVYVRRKGGPTKEQISNHPNFERTRWNNAEFKACTMMTQSIRQALFPLRHLGDPLFTGALNKLAKAIQKTDAADLGQRCIYLSRNRHLLQGFPLNLLHPFDGIVRIPVAVHPDRAGGGAIVSIPELVPGIHLHLLRDAPYYRFCVTLGAAGDITFADGGHQRMGQLPIASHVANWQHRQSPAAATTVQLRLPQEFPDAVTLVLGIGIEQGAPDNTGNIIAVKRSGSAKVLGVF